MGAGAIVLLVLIIAVDVAVLELGKNIIPGWFLSIFLCWGFVLLYRHYLRAGSAWLRLGGWLMLIVLMGVIVWITRPREKAIPAVTGKNPRATGVVTVQQGQLTGVYTQDEQVEVFAGIPYAKPPVGELRWKAPQEPDAWEGVRACDTFAPMSMQKRNPVIMDSLGDVFIYHRYRISLEDNFIAPMSEDSLYLNIWKPAGEVKNVPVLFFIHGGSLTTGQTWYWDYNGEALAKEGIVVVNFAYRLNVFGYFANEELEKESGTTGNYGLLDQIQALKWVKENIAAFGGDPNQITIAGESAGSSSVNALCVSPLTKGLFRRAIAESSSITPKVPFHTFRTREEALKSGKTTMEEFQCTTVEQLRAIPAEKLVNTKGNNSSMMVDGYAIEEQPYLTYEKGENHEEALMAGFNSHEADLFLLPVKANKEDYEEKLKMVYGDFSKEVAQLIPPYALSSKGTSIIERGGSAKGALDFAISAAWFTYPHYDWARYLEQQERPVYLYYFTKENAGLSNNHAGEMPYAYGNLYWRQFLYKEQDQFLSDVMKEYWVRFIRTGDPNGGLLPEWELFQSEEGQVLEFGETVRMTDDPYMSLYPVLDRVQEQRLKESEQ